MDSDTEKFLKKIEELESSREADAQIIEPIVRRADEALRNGTLSCLIELASEITQKSERDVCIRQTPLLRFEEIVRIVSLENECGIKLFTADTDSFSALMKKYERVNMYLRRIELDIESGVEDAYDYIREQVISPFAIAGILYHMTSRIGHRENVLMKLADDSLEHGEVLRAYGFLTVIRSPSEDVLSLKRELGQVIEAMKT